MPSIQQNFDLWNSQHDWDHRGDRWSTVWGGPGMQWLRTIYPRIHSFLPVPTILEIAPGYGRWTQFLRHQCDRLVGVDLSPGCIEACERRFERDTHLEFRVNDGKDLSMLDDASIDFVFSFDSLVHVEADVIETYLAQLSRKMKPSAVAFLHHSNLGEYRLLRRQQRWHPMLQHLFKRMRLMEARTHWRAWSMSADRMCEIASHQGMCCIAQEIVPWSTRSAQIDCMSLIVHQDSGRAGPLRRWRNAAFMEEAAYSGELERLYSGNR